jgi:hypothetical protein
MNGSLHFLLRCVGGVAVAALSLACLQADGQETSTEFWIVRSCQGTSSTGGVQANRFDYRRRDSRGVWTHCSHDAFFHTEGPPPPTVVLVHGGFTDEAWAVHLALGLSHELSRYRAGRRMRLVVWRWPAERTLCRLRPALRVTLARADGEGERLAEWLAQFDQLEPPTFVGYSAGCRVIAGALRCYASGSNSIPGRFRAVLVAAATDTDILLPGRSGASPLDAVETMLVTRHQRDRVLRLYPHVNRGPSPRALGVAGASRPGLPGSHHQRLEVMDLTRYIRGRHDFLHYVSAAPLSARIAKLVDR